MKAAVAVFPGSNCDRDTERACKFFGWDTDFIWHDEKNVMDYDVIFLPGGFSYGDYIRAGRLAKFSPVVMAIKDYVAQKRGFVVGICNGFQILCETGLLPGVLSVNNGTKFICDIADLKADSSLNIPDIKLPIAHGEGRYIIEEDKLPDVVNNLGFLYYKNNPNGSLCDIAGLYDRENKVLGMMPHPERAVFKETGSTVGRYIFELIENDLK